MNLFLIHLLFTTLTYLPLSWEASSLPNQPNVSNRTDLAGTNGKVSIGNEMAMDGTLYKFFPKNKKPKHLWTRDEILKTACLASKIGSDYIGDTRIVELLSSAINRKQITKKDLDYCWHFKRKTLEFMDRQRELLKKVSISTETTLIIDGSGIPTEHQNAILEHAFAKIKPLKSVTISNFPIDKTHKKTLEDSRVTYIFTDSYVGISSQGDFSLDYFKLITDSNCFYFERNKIDNLPEKIESIPVKSLTYLDIFYSDLENFIQEKSASILDKMTQCRFLVGKGNLLVDSFLTIYYTLVNSITKNLINEQLENINSIDFFTGTIEAKKHAELFAGNGDKKSWHTFMLDLRKDNREISSYNPFDLRLFKFVKLFVYLDETSDLSLLSWALLAKYLSKIEITVEGAFDKHDELIQLIKKKSFKSFGFSSFVTNGKNNTFVWENLAEIPTFLQSIESVHCGPLSKNSIMKILQSIEEKLRKVKIEINEIVCESLFRMTKFDSVKDLTVIFSCNRVTKEDIEELFSIFPNLEKFSIEVPFQLVMFEIKSTKLREVGIKCSRMEDEEKFFSKLNPASQFTLVQVQQNHANIKWIKRDGYIYYSFEIFMNQLDYLVERDKEEWNLATRQEQALPMEVDESEECPELLSNHEPMG